MGWSGRAPAPPASEAGKGRQRQGARHVSDIQLRDRRVRPYGKGQKNDFNDAEAIAEAVQRPTMKFVATKTAEQLDVQALHRVRERLVSQRTGIINQIRAFAGSIAPDCPSACSSRAKTCIPNFEIATELCNAS
jgi:transposase